MKSKLLQELRKHPNGIKLSGFDPSGDINLKINDLEKSGYVFEKKEDIICLVSSPDIPFPWEFPRFEPNFHYFKDVKSTMINARELAEKNAPHFTVVIAENQGSGRGRMDRTWVSSGGGLYFTILLRPDIPPALVFRINFIASLTLVKTFRSLLGVEAMVKWPNDILIHEKKLCGILSEMAIDEERIRHINLGIGINVNNDPAEREPKATSLKRVLGKSVSRVDILRRFLETFEENVRDIAGYRNIISEWKDYSITIGRNVKVVTIKDTYWGTAVDVDENGALILEKPDGTREAVIYGDCFLV